MKLSLRKIKYFLFFPLPLYLLSSFFLLLLKLKRTGIISRACQEQSLKKSVAERTTRKESHVSSS